LSISAKYYQHCDRIYQHGIVYVIIGYVVGGDLTTKISGSGHRMKAQSLFVFYTSYNCVYAPALTCSVNSVSTLYVTL